MEIAIPPGVQFGVPYPHHQLIFLSANPLPYLIWWCSKPCVYYPKTVSLSPSLQYLLPLSSHPLAALFVCLVALHLSTLNRILRNLQILPLSLSPLSSLVVVVILVQSVGGWHRPTPMLPTTFSTTQSSRPASVGHTARTLFNTVPAPCFYLHGIFFYTYSPQQNIRLSILAVFVFFRSEYSPRTVCLPEYSRFPSLVFINLFTPREHINTRVLCAGKVCQGSRSCRRTRTPLPGKHLVPHLRVSVSVCSTLCATGSVILP